MLRKNPVAAEAMLPSKMEEPGLAEGSSSELTVTDHRFLSETTAEA